MGVLSKDRIFRRADHVAFTRFGEEMLIVVPQGSWQIVLNGTGARAFELLDGTRTLDEVAQLIDAEYPGAGAEEIVADLDELMGELAAKGAVAAAR